MNTNKNTLNPKNNEAQASPWLLCPSKRFPGKFYYFNGSTGATAWCLSETDRNLKKDSIHRVTDKAHTYPEPVDPPVDDSANTTNSSSLRNNTYFTRNVNRPTPVFGQAVFPKYVPPDIFQPNIVWALAPMYMPCQPPQHWPMLGQNMPTFEEQPMFHQSAPSDRFHFQNSAMYMPSQPAQHRQMMNQRTQTYQEQPMFLQSAPLNRFQPERTFIPDSHFQNSTPFQHFEENTMSDQANTFKTFKKKEATTLAKPQTKDEGCQTFVPRAERLRTQSESDSTQKSALKASRSVENLTLIPKDVEMSTKSPLKKVEKGNDKLRKLDNNDLRFKLESRKKKVEFTMVAEKAELSTVKRLKLGETAGFCTPIQSEATTTREGLQRKRVTFDLEEPGASQDSSQDVPMADQSPDSRIDVPNWYVVADTETLLSELQCIEEYVKSDASCRLMVPYTVYSELESRSRGENGLLSARQLLRRLVSHDNHLVVQSKPEKDQSSEDSIIECCWNLLHEDSHVVLITNSKELMNKAKSIDLECYTTEEIMMADESDTSPQNDVSKLKFVVENDKKKSIIVNDAKKQENMSMQSLKDFNDPYLTTPNGFHVSQTKESISSAETGKDNVFSIDDHTDTFINLSKPKKNVNTVFISDVPNVKNQIVKLSTAETRPIQNITKGITKNVLRNTGVNTTVNQDKAFNLEHSNQKFCGNNIIENVNQDQKSVPKNVVIIDDVELNVRRLNMIENNQAISRDTIKESGITNVNNKLNLDQELQRFHVKNFVGEARVNSKLDEWVCRLNQTMEGALTDLLLKEKVKIKRIMPPWNLYEAIQVTGDIYKRQLNIKSVIDKFSAKLLSCSSNNGRLKKDMKPNDFMKLVGFSVILIQNLKEISNCNELYDAEESLQDLIKNIEDPKTDIDLSLEKLNTPLFMRSELSDLKAPIGFRKSRTEIIEYLKKHFVAWQTDTDTEETVHNKIDKEPNILITSGKNLNTVKINNTRAITVENPAKGIINTFNENNDEANVNQPKVIRSVNIIDAFEERIKKRTQFELDELDYEENDSMYSMSDNTQIKSEGPDDWPEHDLVLGDLSVTECIGAYTLAKRFLIKLKGALILIFNFTKASLQEYQEGMSADKKAEIELNTELLRRFLLKTAQRLKNIIARESGEGVTLKRLLIKAGYCVEDDPVMANYKQTITKYLELIQGLQEVLEHNFFLGGALGAGQKKLFKKIPPKNAYAASPNSDRTCCSLRTLSPILPSHSRSNVKRHTLKKNVRLLV